MDKEIKDLREVHQRLEEMFYQHQQALLCFDFPAARKFLKEYDEAVQHHTGLEEEWLMPIYEERGRCGPGGDAANFVGEHSKILMFLRRLEEKLEKVKGLSASSREFIDLLDDETHFKQLVRHHDEREERFLFPELDRVTNEEEKKRLLAKMGSR
jgi:hemerythrin-like domain-containing protein